MRRIKVFGVVILCVIGVYLVGVYSISYLIDNGYTNAKSSILVMKTSSQVSIPASNVQVHAYIQQHPEDKEAIYDAYAYLHGTGVTGSGRFPDHILQDKGFMFILNGIDKRKVVIDTIKKESEKLGIDYTVVISSLLGEQIRIACSGFRGSLKEILLNSTPTLLRSYNISLGIGGIKRTAAIKIQKDAKKYGYGQVFGSGVSGSGLEERLTDSDYRQGVYPTYLVKNIITRRQLSGYDISHNPGVIATLYNMGNPEKKQPNAFPQIGGSDIEIGNHTYIYGGISMAIYRYLKIYK